MFGLLSDALMQQKSPEHSALMVSLPVLAVNAHLPGTQPGTGAIRAAAAVRFHSQTEFNLGCKRHVRLATTKSNPSRAAHSLRPQRTRPNNPDTSCLQFQE